MKILLTGASGRIGRAIYNRLSSEHEVVGYDAAPSSTADIVANLADSNALKSALRGCDAVIHTAALHAPHVGIASDAAFESINVECTKKLVQLCLELGVKQLVYTSTTALYGSASAPKDRAGWVTEATVPCPRTIYHRTKLQAEAVLQSAAQSGALVESGRAAKAALAVTILRMSRCFPEPAPMMACYRLHRGVDARDVAAAHACALNKQQQGGFHTYIISGATPFLPADCAELLHDAASVIKRRAPELAAAFASRGWNLPNSIDRVYSSAKAEAELAWRPNYGYAEVLAEFDRKSSEVLAPQQSWSAQE